MATLDVYFDDLQVEMLYGGENYNLYRVIHKPTGLCTPNCETKIEALKIIKDMVNATIQDSWKKITWEIDEINGVIRL